MVTMGSSLALRSFFRQGSIAEALDGIAFGTTNTYIKENVASSQLEFYVQGAQAMSMSAYGGVMHGTWIANSPISVSDRRLKTNINPLMRTLRQNQEEPQRAIRGRAGGQPTPTGERPSTAQWLLRELRPVSYSFKTGHDAKQVRFGFIADEMERVLPQVVRELPRSAKQSDSTEAGDAAPKKGIVYPDLIAVLTTMVKELSGEVKELMTRVQSAESELDEMERGEEP